jgi:mono/diheme cytochrome c family protein
MSSRGRGRAMRIVAWAAAAIVAVGCVILIYLVLGPGPTDYARGKRVAIADYRERNPTGVPADFKASGDLQRGEYLTKAADCVVCHTSKEGVPFAGGRAFVLPFGTLYSTNITPDLETGIGKYSDRNFLDAVHKGIGRDGAALYPAMPYPSYSLMSDADALAIKAYLFSLQPVRAPAPANTLIFPFNQRVLMRIWAAMFNPDKRFEPNVEQSAEWNRGAYLVDAMEHCGECHTPRNLAFALNNRKKFAGAIQAGWRAFNITADPASGIGTWSKEDLARYLSTGHATGHGTAAGPMGEAVDESISQLTGDDVAAMVTYLRTTPGVATADLHAIQDKPASDHHGEGLAADVAREGKSVYEGSCMGCHEWSGVSPGMPFATLTGSRAVNDPTATNVAQVVIDGAIRRDGDGLASMPAFGNGYSNAEIASVANYVTARFGGTASHLEARDVEKLRQQD